MCHLRNEEQVGPKVPTPLITYGIFLATIHDSQVSWRRKRWEPTYSLDITFTRIVDPHSIPELASETPIYMNQNLASLHRAQ